MPELPEVETVKNVLNTIVVNTKITKIDVLHTNTIKSDLNEFIHELTGETFKNVSRIGKFLIFHLSNDKVIISHLRMEGKFYEVNENDKNTYYSRVVFHLDNGKKLCFDDSRCFGILIYSTEKEYKNVKDIKKLGPEPFDIQDVNYLIKRTKNKKIPIKTQLLDQSLMAGIGNIYVDETLFKSKIHPWTPSNLITKDEWQKILNNACEILNLAIKMGGSTIRSYHPGKGIDGSFQTAIRVYGKANTKCPDCGATLRFVTTNGRGTTFCPHCQIKKGSQLRVAITGKVGSGKTLMLDAFKERGYETISSDEIVNKVYGNPDIGMKIEKILNIKFANHAVDKKQLREYLIKNPNDKKKVERIVHPKVINEIDNFLKKSKTDIVVAEIPLLFESHLDDRFDTIIAIETDEKSQINHLNARNAATLDLLKINKTSLFDINKNKATYIVNNSNSLSLYKKEIDKVINKVQLRLN
ncbi:MAG: DNA-formamidopyrimidine glycosylase [Bacilli bacterium]|nr:DNA-formamidopyrimidine glycosylase [Bacilli bacterium]